MQLTLKKALRGIECGGENFVICRIIYSTLCGIWDISSLFLFYLANQYLWIICVFVIRSTSVTGVSVRMPEFVS